MFEHLAQTTWMKGAAGLGLLLMMGAGGAGAEEETFRNTCNEVSWQRFEVEHRGFKKTITFAESGTREKRTLEYKGIPWSRDSALNLVVDRNIYERGVHRVRYRFDDPWSGQPLELKAHAVSHEVRGVPIRSDDTQPRIELFAQGNDTPRGRLFYAWEGAVLFAGELDGHQVEIERLSPPTKAERGVFKYLLFPFPLEGEFAVRIDGCEVAHFTQGRVHGMRVSYELELAADGGVPRQDALLGFLVFDMMRHFIQGAVS